MNGLKKITADRIILRGLQLTWFIVCVTFGYLAFFYRNLPPLVPLYNQQPWGDARLGQKFELLLPLGLSICIILINIYIASLVYEKMPLISRILIIMALLGSIVTGIFIFRTTQLVM